MEKTISVIKKLKKGNFILINDIPCKVMNVNLSKSGKHGGAKCRIDGMGIFDGKRKSIVKPADSKVDVPIIVKKKAQILAIIGDKAQLMDLSDYSTLELDIPDELKNTLNSGEEINYYEVADIKTLKPLK